MTILAPGGGPRWVWLASGLGAAGLLFGIGQLYEWLRGVQGMGFGDVKLALCMGFFLGTAVIPALFIGFIAGAVAGVVLLSRGRRRQDRDPLRSLPRLRRRRGAALRAPAHRAVPARRPAVAPPAAGASTPRRRGSRSIA